MSECWISVSLYSPASLLYVHQWADLTPRQTSVHKKYRKQTFVEGIKRDYLIIKANVEHHSLLAFNFYKTTYAQSTHAKQDYLSLFAYRIYCKLYTGLL